MATVAKSLKDIAQDFHWGRVIDTFEVGPYGIIKYHPRKRQLVSSDHIDEATTDYHVYVYGRDTSRSYHSLDAALAGAIAYRSEGPNHRGDIYFTLAMEELLLIREADQSAKK